MKQTTKNVCTNTTTALCALHHLILSKPHVFPDLMNNAPYAQILPKRFKSQSFRELNRDSMRYLATGRNYSYQRLTIPTFLLIQTGIKQSPRRMFATRLSQKLPSLTLLSTIKFQSHGNITRKFHQPIKHLFI